jgi:hypothetical protein
VTAAGRTVRDMLDGTHSRVTWTGDVVDVGGVLLDLSTLWNAAQLVLKGERPRKNSGLPIWTAWGFVRGVAASSEERP